jgi:hypothetical protein
LLSRIFLRRPAVVCSPLGAAVDDDDDDDDDDESRISLCAVTLPTTARLSPARLLYLAASLWSESLALGVLIVAGIIECSSAIVFLLFSEHKKNVFRNNRL